MRFGVFNFTTGYSVPDAVKQALEWAKVKDFNFESLLQTQNKLRQEELSKRKIYFTLNQLMFLGSENSLRYRILEKFYQLPFPTIERFYRSELKWWDKLRIFSGKPPIPITEAAKTLWASRRRERAA
jgi:lycopene beta-cyclase